MDKKEHKAMIQERYVRFSNNRRVTEAVQSARDLFEELIRSGMTRPEAIREVRKKMKPKIKSATQKAKKG